MSCSICDQHGQSRVWKFTWPVGAEVESAQVLAPCYDIAVGLLMATEKTDRRTGTIVVNSPAGEVDHFAELLAASQRDTIRKLIALKNEEPSS